MKVAVEYNKVIILRNVASQSVVFGEEGDQLLRGAVVGELVRLNAFVPTHEIEELSTVASSLHSLVHIKIENTEWTNFFGFSNSILEE